MLAAILRWKTTARIITDVAAQCGVELSRADFQSFEAFETELHSTALGRPQDRSKRHINLVLRLPQQIIKYLQWGEHRLSSLRFYLVKVIRLVKRLYHERGSQ